MRLIDPWLWPLHAVQGPFIGKDKICAPLTPPAVQIKNRVAYSYFGNPVIE